MRLIESVFLAFTMMSLVGVGTEPTPAPLTVIYVSTNATPAPNGTWGYELTLETSKVVYQFNEPVFVSMMLTRFRGHFPLGGERSTHGTEKSTSGVPRGVPA
jgi:hypothetical protein